MENNKYYQEQQLAISKLITDEKFDDALKIINEELSMPYIPRNFEAFLVESINKIPLSTRSNSYSLSLDKIVDLLIKLDNSPNDVSDLIKHMSKFNLENEKEELEYYFSKSTNTRNRAMTFELLIKMKVDIECDLGNPSKSTSIEDLDDFKKDVSSLETKVADNPEYKELMIELLKEIYLTKHVGQSLEGDFADAVIITTGIIFENEELKSLVSDLDAVENKLKSFKSFDNL